MYTVLSFRCFKVLFLIFITSQALASQVKFSEPLPKDSPKQSFLYSYFGFDEKVHTLIELITKDIQYVIANQFIDSIVGRFELTNPVKHFEIQDKSSEIEYLTFSSDDSHLFFAAYGFCETYQWCAMMADLELDKEAQLLAPEIVYQAAIEIQDMALSPNDSSLAIHLSEGSLIGYPRIVLIKLEDFEAKEWFELPGIEEFLAQTISADDQQVIDAGIDLKKKRNATIDKIDFTPEGNLVFITNAQEAGIIDRETYKCKRIRDTKQQYLLNQPVHYKSKGRDKVELFFILRSYIHPHTSKSIFYASHNRSTINTTTIFDYAAGKCTTLSVGNQTVDNKDSDCICGICKDCISNDCIDEVALSPDGQYAVIWFYEQEKHHLKFIDIGSHNVIKEYYYDIYVQPAHTVDPRISFKKNSQFLLLVCFGWGPLILDSMSGRIIALVHSEIFDMSYGLFNRAGTYFATAIKKSSEACPHESAVLSLWKWNPLWTELKDLYRGRITLKQAFLILFLRIAKLKGYSVKDYVIHMTKEPSISHETVMDELREVFNSLSKPYKAYVRRFL